MSVLPLQYFPSAMWLVIHAEWSLGLMGIGSSLVLHLRVQCSAKVYFLGAVAILRVTLWPHCLYRGHFGNVCVCVVFSLAFQNRTM